jgi:UDP-N-acetylglucosamine/UDP-N-acetylgalactosamine diphosphorylase
MAIPSREATWYSTVELERLAGRGVRLPRPDQVAIRRDVPLDRIAPGARLYPFCRLIGAATRVDAGAELGAGGAVTLDNAWVGVSSAIGTLGPVLLRNVACGPSTVLGCGVAEDAVFLGKETQDTPFTAGSGFRVRKGSLYEEDASSAQHTDTKMTILLPWVTLGSSLNWCDLLVAGGAGPGQGEFTEIGSGAIHFNFTPRGDKATGSLLVNAADGAFLDRPRLFIGGNTSLIGPLAGDFGAITVAGGRYGRRLRPGLNTPDLSMSEPAAPFTELAFDLEIYVSIKRLYETQVLFVGELAALDAWYGHVRAHIARGHPDRTALYERARSMVKLNLHERISQLGGLARRMESSVHRLAQRRPNDPRLRQHEALLRAWPEVETHLRRPGPDLEPPPEFVRALEGALEGGSERYTDTVRRLSLVGRTAGRTWLAAVRDRVASIEILEKVPAL